MMKQFLFIFTLTTAFLNGGIDNYLKKAENKSSANSYKNIDFIYMINLDQRPEKFQKSIEQLHPYGIYPYRFSAVNGWELSLKAINDVGFKYGPGMQKGILGTTYRFENDLMPSEEILDTYGRAYFVHCMARGTIGICLSHLSVLQDAYDSNYKIIWVMEDDIEVLKDPRTISHLIDHLDAHVGYRNWDVLFTDRDIRDQNGRHIPCYSADIRRPDFFSFAHNDYSYRKIVSSEFIRVGARYGAHSMLLTRSGIKKILNFIKEHQIFLPYDMEYYLPPGIRLYTTQEDIVSNLPKAISDNGGANYLNKNAP